MTEGRDWIQSQFERCPDCGADAAAVPDDDLGAEVAREVARWGRMLASADPSMVRVRPDPAVWSALEYACHVRDLLNVMAARVDRMRREDDPVLDWWDHEAAIAVAAAECRHEDQVPVLVVEDMTTAARRFAGRLAEVDGADWDRSATRRPGEHFTVRGLARFVLHEVIHHRDDAARSLKGAST